jgi:hypothetical protein
MVVVDLVPEVVRPILDNGECRDEDRVVGSIGYLVVIT